MSSVTRQIRSRLVLHTVPLKSKEDDFSGKESLILRKNSPQRTLVGLELHNNEVALHGDGVYIGKQQVGIVQAQHVHRF